MVSEKSKTGSPIRKGFDYQDLTALRLALELYVQPQEYQLFIEYEKIGNLDDIVVEYGDSVDAYQVKYHVSPNEVYTIDDFTDPDGPKRVYFEKFSSSWISLKERYPDKRLTLHLLSNGTLDAELVGLITRDGFFIHQFTAGSTRGRRLTIRNALLNVTKLAGGDFEEFLSCFHFQMKQPDLDALVQYIQADLLDHRLGLSDRSIYYELKQIVENFAIARRDPLSPQLLDDILRQTQRRYLLPQRFEVDRATYIDRNDIKTQLDTALESVDGDYVVITGLPGSGKSTSLTVYLDDQEQPSKYTMVRYYCFVDLNDNYQKRRLEAQTLRVNLLSIFQDEFHDLLPRRFDYSENNFYQALGILGAHFTSKAEKLIIVLDGLDHAERMESGVQETILDALPRSLPKGVVIVVGTQELHKWPLFLKRNVENPNTHIAPSLFTLNQTTEYLIEKKQLTKLSQEQVREIHRKADGLPLYLRYIAERLNEAGDVAQELAQIPVVPEGNIKDYYEMLWQEFESIGRGNARHLCGVLACLRFPVHKDELFSFQSLLNRPEFDDCYQLVRHLLRERANRIEIFHNSFREFILSKLDPDWVQEICKDITNHLKSCEGSDQWFSYVFEYACRAKDYNYVIDKVNRDFVDYALSRYRSVQDIENAIYWAAGAAKERSDVLALSRLGALKSGLRERIENHLDKTLLSKALLAMGKEADVIHYSYSVHQNQWLVDTATALNLLRELPNQGKKEIGEELFWIFEESIRGRELETRTDLINFAYCLGIYSKSLDRPLKWLSQSELQRDILETEQSYVPGYAPHLEAFLEAIVKYKPVEVWRELEKTQELFPDQLIRYLLIRSIARCGQTSILKQEIEEYVSLFRPTSNPELAYYAALARLPIEVVSTLLGSVVVSPLDHPEHLSHSDPVLHNHRLTFFALGYEGKKASIEKIRNQLKSEETWWSTYLLYLLQAGECVGTYWAQVEEDWFRLALDSIDILRRIKRNKGERIVELLTLCRDELVESLYWLTRIVEEHCPERLEEWFNRLRLLQDCEIWTIHYGINESIRDYEFELRIYEKLSSNPRCHPHLIQLLDVCEEKFNESTLLKGGSRSSHFLRLALIAAKCGFKSKAEEWLQHGIKSTLIYGYHADATLFHLIDMLEMLNKHEPELALNRCADILEMVDWMPHLTDGKETRYLPHTIFEQVAKLSENAALRLLRLYAKNKARWQMQDCLETFIEQVENIDYEILWALTSLFANHFSDDGRHPKQVVNAKQHVVEKVAKLIDEQVLAQYKQRLDQFIRTNITPRHWSTLTSPYWQPQNLISQCEENSESISGNNAESQLKTYKLDGKDITMQDIEKRLNTSFEAYKETLQKLKDENQHFLESELTKPALELHIVQTSQSAGLLDIRDHIVSNNKWDTDLLRKLARRFMDIGETESGIECLEVSYANTMDWQRWKRTRQDFETIAQYDRQRAKSLLVNECYRCLTETEYKAYEVPALVGTAYDVWNDAANLRCVYLDYLRHCQGLFEQLPKRDEYEWLRSYRLETDDLNQSAVNFLVDELATVEIDLGNRLTDACRDLCLTRPALTLPILIERLSDMEELVKSRLFTILYTVAFEMPNLLASYAEAVSDLLDSKHFQYKMGTIKLLQSVSQQSIVAPTVEEKLKLAQSSYSPTILRSSFRLLHVSPSRKFEDFFKRNVARPIRQQIVACCEILSIDEKDVLTKIEHSLREEGWNEEDGYDRLRDEWDGYVHPQGYPVVWIISSFNLRVFGLFNRVVDEVVEKTSLTVGQIEGLWRVLQPADPEYKLSNIAPRPDDISPLAVLDKDAWLDEISNEPGKVSYGSITQAWITLFEERTVSQDTPYETPYRSSLLLYSSLINRGLQLPFNTLKAGSFHVLKLQKFHDNELVTLNQARELLLDKSHSSLTVVRRQPFLPILTWQTNSPLFLGYGKVVSLASYLIQRYGLVFRNFDLYEDNKCVVKYEVWQEGYEDETYTRELLSCGTRLSIHASLLERIFRDYDVELCQSTLEKRLYWKSKYHPEPTQANSREAFMIISG